MIFGQGSVDLRLLLRKSGIELDADFKLHVFRLTEPVLHLGFTPFVVSCDDNERVELLKVIEVLELINLLQYVETEGLNLHDTIAAFIACVHNRRCKTCDTRCNA